MSRLEEIKANLDRFMAPESKAVLFRDDAEWLISRVEKLETRCTEIAAESAAQEERLQKRNHRYKQALEFYANKEVYQIDFNKMDIPEDVIDMTPDIISDNGETAHKALKGESE